MVSNCGLVFGFGVVCVGLCSLLVVVCSVICDLLYWFSVVFCFCGLSLVGMLRALPVGWVFLLFSLFVFC